MESVRMPVVICVVLVSYGWMEFGRMIWLDHNAESVAYKKKATLSNIEHWRVCSCLRDLFPDSGPNLNIIEDRIGLMSNQAHIWPGSQLLLSPLRLILFIYQSLPRMCPVSIDGMHCGAALLVRIQTLIPIHDHHYTFWVFWVFCVMFLACWSIQLLNEAVTSLFCGKAALASGPPGVRRNDPHQRCPGKTHQPRGQWSAKMFSGLYSLITVAKMEGCCSLSWNRKWMNMSSCIVVRNFEVLQKQQLNAFGIFWVDMCSLTLRAQAGGLEQPWTYTFRAVSLPNPMLEAPCPCGGKCGRTHAEKLWHICITPLAKASTKATAATNNRNNTASTTITNSGKEESEKNNVVFSSERASQSL